jgi:hypothetical protein
MHVCLSVSKLLGALTDHLDSGLYRSSVILIVGTAKVQYTLHKDLLCFYSDFFRAALNGSFKEATEHRIELPEVQIDVFEAFQVWLYTQSLPRNEIVPTKVYPEWSLLVGLWIFGDGHQTPLFQNNVMDAMLAKVDEDLQVPTKVLNLAYDNTLPNSPLRKALTDIMVYRSKMPTGDNSDEIKLTPLGVLEDWPKQACLDVIAEMSRGWTNKAPRHCIPKREKCHYHVHAKDEHC